MYYLLLRYGVGGGAKEYLKLIPKSIHLQEWWQRKAQCLHICMLILISLPKNTSNMDKRNKTPELFCAVGFFLVKETIQSHRSLKFSEELHSVTLLWIFSEHIKNQQKAGKQNFFLCISINFSFSWWIKSLFIVISEMKFWWNVYGDTDSYLRNCASGLMSYKRFSSCVNFYLRLPHFPFCFCIPPNLQHDCAILGGYQIQNGLTFCMVSASSSFSEIPCISLCPVIVSFSGLFLMWGVCFPGSC